MIIFTNNCSWLGGGSCGYFSLLSSINFKDVVAVEASPSTFARLKRNIELNNLSNVVCHNIAVGDKIGTAPFYHNPNDSGISSMSPGQGKVIEAEVPVKPLFDIIDLSVAKRIGFIKIDIEGIEHIVLRQIFDNIKLLPNDIKIMVEYGPERSGDLRQVLDLFREVGFAVHLLQGQYSVEEYLKDQKDDLPILTEYPSIFCDLLLVRQGSSLSFKS